MADTKWLDPASWTLADWEDSTKRPLYSHLWNTLKGGADERVAFAEQSHDSGFTSANTFPDFNQDKSIFISSENSPTNATRIENACYPKDCLLTSDMASGNTISTNADIPTELTLADILDELGYTGDTEMLHMEDTLSGTRPALSLMTWVKQWYQVMDYPVYYNRSRTDTSWVTAVNTQYTQIDVQYVYNQDTNTFISAKADVIHPSTFSTATNVYVTNDLNETAPFSTPQEVRDYAITTYDNNNNTSWGPGWASTGSPIGSEQQEIAQTGNTGIVTIQVKLTSRRIRFKPVQEYRATSPNRYDSNVYYYGYFTDVLVTGGGSGTYSAFGTGATEDESDLDLVTADGSGWYIFEIAGVDFDTESVLTVPVTPGSGTTVNDQLFGLSKTFLNPDQATITVNQAGAIFEPNLTAGTAWEWYTPAP